MNFRIFGLLEEWGFGRSPSEDGAGTLEQQGHSPSGLCFSGFSLLLVTILGCGLVPAPSQAQFTQQAKLVGTGVIGILAFQGFSVSLSSDGNTAIVGGPLDDVTPGTAERQVGASWVFTRSDGKWSQQAKLTGGDTIGSTGRQGTSVSISGDGKTAIVGGPGDNGGVLGVGAAWIFTRSSGVWSQFAKLVGTDTVGEAAQGNSVALSGDGNTAIVGGFANDNGVGASWVFTRSGGGGWSQEAKLIAGDATGMARQGYSVSLSRDGSTAFIGGPADDGDVGAAWVFTRSNGVWSEQAKLVGTDAIGHSGQGASVSISADGNTAIVGGPGDHVVGPSESIGAAWVFARLRGTWIQQAKLIGTGVIGSFAIQGGSVSLSADGNTAIVGGDFDNPQFPPANDPIGAAWVFKRSGGVWSQQEKLVGTDVIGDAATQGQSVSISADASTALVGGPVDNNGIGAAWVFTQPMFAGTPGKPNCHGQSVSALARQYGGLNAAAAALGYADVSALQNAIMAFCGN
jgi:hypothetical protein